jgi:uncharacterized protein with GYD domain
MIIMHRIPINPARGAGDFVVAGSVDGIKAGSVEAGTEEVGVAVVLAGVTVGFSIILNVEDPDTSIVTPDTLTIYSSGLNVDASTLKDQRLNPFVPGSTLTVPAAAENSPLCTF